MARITVEQLAKSLQELQPSSLAKLSGTLQRLVENRLWLQVILGMLAGVLAGILMGPDMGWMNQKTANIITSWLAAPGYLFLSLIQMIVVPLILASVIRGLASASSITELKLLGIYSGAFFLGATVVAAGIGIGLTNLLEPGAFVDTGSISQLMTGANMQNNVSSVTVTVEDLPQYVVGLIPSNPLQAFSAGDMLRIVVFSIIFGIALMSIPTEKSVPIYSLLGSLQEVCMTIVGWAMRLAPLAVFGLVAKLTSAVGMTVLVGILVYILTVIAGLVMVAMGYLLIIGMVGRCPPWVFIKKTSEVLLLAFSTSSSAAVMPITMRSLEEKLKLGNATIRFVIPLGTTINMSGTALYQATAIIFLAQVFQVDISSTMLLLMIGMIVFASIGSPATPGASIIMLSMMLDNLGIPAGGIAILLGADRILDMCRTTVNVMGDMTASIVVDRIVGAKMNQEEKGSSCG